MTLDDLLWRWVTWRENGMTVGFGTQQVASWLRGRSDVYRSGASFENDVDSIEFKVDKAVAALGVADSEACKVLVCEFGIRLQHLRQLDRAVSVDMTLRTYQRRLKIAKDFVAAKLSDYFAA